MVRGVMGAGGVEVEIKVEETWLPFGGVVSWEKR